MAVPVPPSARGLPQLAVLALVLVASQFTIARLVPGLGTAGRASFPSAITLMLLLSAPMALCLWASRDIARKRSTFWLMASVAITGLAMRAVYIGAPALLEDDHYRYLLDGAMVAHGLNPYRFAPEALLAGTGLPDAVAALAAEGRAALLKINFPDLRTIYPGTAQLLFALAHKLAPWQLDGLRLVMMTLEAASAVLLVMLLRKSGKSPLWVALYWCNPLLVFTLSGQAHAEAALVPFVLGAMLAAHGQRAVVAGLLLGLAVGVKLWPILLVPMIGRWLGPLWLKGAVSFGLVVLMMCAPLFMSTLQAGSGLVAYAGGWSNNNAPYAWASYGMVQWLGAGVGERALRLAIAAVMATTALVLARRPVVDLADAVGRALCLSAVLFYLSPAQFPWYSAWFLPFAVLAGNRALILAAVTLPVYYLYFPMDAAGLRDAHGFGVAALHVVPVFTVLVWGAFKSSKGEASP